MRASSEFTAKPFRVTQETKQHFGTPTRQGDKTPKKGILKLTASSAKSAKRELESSQSKKKCTFSEF